MLNLIGIWARNSKDLKNIRITGTQLQMLTTAGNKAQRITRNLSKQTILIGEITGKPTLETGPTIINKVNSEEDANLVNKTKK